MSRCVVCGADLAAGARFCAQCGAAVELTDLQAGSRKTVTVLFCDLTDSTRLGERLDPETFQRLMARYYGLMRDCVRRHGGAIEKFIGDAVMAVFGVPRVHEDDALRAVRAALEMRAAVALLDAEVPQLGDIPIRVRIGINTGEVVTVGDPGPGQMLASGDAVNTAARLEQAAQPEEILLGAQTRAVLGSAVDAEPAGQLALKGKAAGVTAFRLVSLDDEAEAVARNFDLPLVGRERELQLLQLVLARVSEERSCHLLTIFGEPGVGKSRLARELMAVAQTHGAVVGYGACHPYGHGRTMSALGDAFRQLLNRRAYEPAAEADASDALAALHAGLLRDDTPGGSDDQLRWAVLEVLEMLGAERTVVVVLDDVHWAHPALLELIDQISDWSEAVPVVLVCCARTELLETHPNWASGKLDSTALTLGPLNDAGCRELMAVASEVQMHNVELVEQVVRRSEGNPLYLEQLLQMVHDDASASVPLTVSALIMARLDRLDADDRERLQCASVVGSPFTAAQVGVILDTRLAGPQSSLEAALRGLCRRRLLESARSTAGEDERQYNFASSLIQEVAYAAVPKAVRAPQHEQLAEWFVEQSEVSDDAGHHLERAYRLHAELGDSPATLRPLRQLAAHHLAAAGSRAVRRGDVAFSATMLGRAHVLSQAGDPERPRIMESYAETKLLQGDAADGVAVLREIIAEPPTSDPLTHAHARLQLALIDSANGGFARSAVVAREVLPVFEEAQDHFGQARAWLRIGQARQVEGQFLDADTALEQALAHALPIDAELERATVVGALATSLLLGPRPVDDALTRCHDLADRYVTGRRVARAAVSCPLGLLHAVRGEFDEARTLVGLAQTIVEDLGHVFAAVALDVYAASIEIMAGHGGEVIDRLRTGQAEASRIGDAHTAAFAAQYLARELLGAGQPEPALVAIADFDRAGVSASTAALYGIRARIHAHQGREAPARTDASKSIELAMATDSLASRGTAYLDRAYVLQSVGDIGVAAESADTAERAFAAKGHQVGLREVADFRAMVE